MNLRLKTSTLTCFIFFTFLSADESNLVNGLFEENIIILPSEYHED
jgi:hypothetical protein